jgi:antitoxin (DNA-binding transcriptional repressor) of toxin-antitoxin stability system
VSTVTLQDAALHFREFVRALKPGEEVVITDEDRPIAKLTASAEAPVEVKLGRCRGMLTILAEDDDHLADFAEYMP